MMDINNIFIILIIVTILVGCSIKMFLYKKTLRSNVNTVLDKDNSEVSVSCNSKIYEEDLLSTSVNIMGKDLPWDPELNDNKTVNNVNYNDIYKKSDDSIIMY